ncbi:formyl transferase [Bordetella hinzii]|uniref:methionyl-tRNA formyltransferase n=1 Tax=Bordetella hinzii TaxID=103855 RepID=UPI0013EFDEE8|nr:formyltransferase family protein [Bordetella hinzii]QII83333.1 formyl transferase [Bordetella hinzii]
MKFAAIGRHEALLQTVERLLSQGHELAYVVTAQEAPEYKAGVADFQALAARQGVPCIVAARLDATVTARLAGLGAEVGVSMNFPTVIGKAAIDLFPLGLLNAHGGDLPRYRGNACQAWALINGEDHIGLCIHQMVADELDSGDVLAKAVLAVDANTRIGQVSGWMEHSIPGLFAEALAKLAQDPGYVLYRQLETGQRPLRCYPRRPEDGRIDWARPAEEVVRFINACGPPYAGAFFEFEGVEYRLDEADYVPAEEAYCAIPGQVARIHRDGSVDIACRAPGYCRIATVRDGQGRSEPLGSLIRSVRQRLG